MSYSRVVANVRFDNPHAQGMLTKLGIGRDWDANEPRDELRGFTPDIGGQYGWHHEGQFEYIPPLGGIAPIGGVTWADMSISAWKQTGAVVSGLWRESANSGALRFKHLWAYGGGTSAATAEIVSNAAFGPSLMFSVWRFAVAFGETRPPLFAIVLKGTTADYAFVFPGTAETKSGYTVTATGETGENTQPELWGRPFGESGWTVIDRWSSGTAPKLDIGASPVHQYIRVETLDDTLLLSMSGTEGVWAYAGKWQSRGGVTVPAADVGLTDGVVRLVAIAAPVMVNVQELAYPASVTLYPRSVLIVTDKHNLMPVYSTIGTAETGTNLTTAVDAQTTHAKRPAVTFAATDTTRRAILYTVQEKRDATVGSASSDPNDTDTSDTLQAMHMSGSLNDAWRGATLTVELQPKPGETLGVIVPNARVQAFVSTDDPESYAGHEGDFTTLFSGYADGPEMRKALARTSETVTASDIIEARLARKLMMWHCSYENWVISTAFTHILNRAGVPAANIDAGSFTGRLPSGTQKGARKLRFGPDIDVPAALDALAESVNLRWGAKADGKVTLWSPLVHTAGAYDYTLDEDTTNIDQVAESFAFRRSVEGFANRVTVMAGEGTDAKSKTRYNTDSIWTSTADDFIGDVWPLFVRLPDGDYNQVAAMAAQLLTEASRYIVHAQWDMWDMPEILPGEYVRMQVSGMGPKLLNSIFRIKKKDWTCAGADGSFGQTLEAVLVQAGT